MQVRKPHLSTSDHQVAILLAHLPLHITNTHAQCYLGSSFYWWETADHRSCRIVQNFKPTYRRLLFLEGTYTFWGRPPCPPPPPKPPFRCPHQDKKGTNLLLFQIGIHLHTHEDLKLKCCRVMGQKLRYGRPCTRDLPGIHNWHAQSQIASISSEFHWLSHAGTIL
jgi:hypothetical protein